MPLPQPRTRLPRPNTVKFNDGTTDYYFELARNRNGERLWRETTVKVQPGQGELIKVWDSWHSGMGVSRDETRDAEYAAPVFESGTVNATRRGFVYPATSPGTVDLTTNVGNLSGPSAIHRVCEVGDYIYFFGSDGTDIHVMKIDPSDDSLVYRRTLSGWAMPAGQPTESGGYLYVPSAGGVFKELTTVCDDLTAALLISGSQTDSAFDLAADGDDGYLRKTSTTYAGARSATATVWQANNLRVGQTYNGANYFIRRSYLRFDTSTIPDGDTVQSATLRLYLLANYSDTDFTIQVRAFTWGATLAAGDWRATPSGDTLIGSYATSGLPAVNNWIDITIDTTAISKTGTTEFYLISSRDDDDPGTAPTGDEDVIFEDRENAGAHAAQLLVTHGNPVTITDNTTNANTLGGTAFTLLGDNSDDVFYWGCPQKFDGIYFNITTPADAALTLDWEFWNGSAWTDIIGPETDGTVGFTEDGWVTWAAGSQTAWATTTINGITAYFVRVKTATAASTWPTATWTPPCDVLTDGPSNRKAWHMGTAGKLLWRAGDASATPKHYVVNSCSAVSAGGSGGPLTDTNWAEADYVIGKAGRNINSLSELNRFLHIGKDDGLFYADVNGDQSNALDFTRNLMSAYNCIDTVRWLGTLVTMGSNGSTLWQFTGASSRAIGIETLGGNTSSVKGGRYICLGTSGLWLWAIYLVGSTYYLLAGRPGGEDESPVVWHQPYAPSWAVNAILVSGLSTNPKLWLAGWVAVVATKTIFYLPLAKDGSPDPTDSALTFNGGSIDLPAVDWGMPGTTKRGHYVEVVLSQAEGTNGTCQIYYRWDNTTGWTQLGANITTIGSTRRFWTAGTTDSGKRPQVRVTQVAGSNEMRLEKVILSCVARPRKEPALEFTVRLYAGGPQGNKTVEAQWDDLWTLSETGLLTVYNPDDPEGTATHSAFIDQMEESKGEQIEKQEGDRYVRLLMRVIKYA